MHALIFDNPVYVYGRYTIVNYRSNMACYFFSSDFISKKIYLIEKCNWNNKTRQKYERNHIVLCYNKCYIKTQTKFNSTSRLECFAAGTHLKYILMCGQVLHHKYYFKITCFIAVIVSSQTKVIYKFYTFLQCRDIIIALWWVTLIILI